MTYATTAVQHAMQGETNNAKKEQDDGDATSGMPEDIILSTSGLTKDFGGFTAVNGVDLKVRRGTIHALIGPNGAGKTTCFNLLTKFLSPTKGAIVYNGRDITAREAGRDRPARAGALLPDLGGVPAAQRR